MLSHQFFDNYHAAAAHLRQCREGDCAARRHEETQEEIGRAAAPSRQGREQVINQQLSMLPCPAVPGCCLVSLRFLCDIHSIHPV